MLLGARHSLIVYVYYYTSHLKHRPKLTISMLARYIASFPSLVLCCSPLRPSRPKRIILHAEQVFFLNNLHNLLSSTAHPMYTAAPTMPLASKRVITTSIMFILPIVARSAVEFFNCHLCIKWKYLHILSTFGLSCYMYGCIMHLCPCGYAYIFMCAMKIV